MGYYITNHLSKSPKNPNELVYIIDTVINLGSVDNEEPFVCPSSCGRKQLGPSSFPFYFRGVSRNVLAR